MISVAAELAEMHPQTLRIYEARGLINPKRSPRNTRLYSQRDVERLRRIQQMTADGGLNCAGCHGGMEATGGAAPFTITDANGDFVASVNWQAPALNTVLLRFDEEEVFDILVYGRPFSPMPAWGLDGGGALNDQQINNLIAYLEEIQITPEEAQAQSAAGGLGGADEPWPFLLRDLDAGRLQPRYGEAGLSPCPGVRPDRSIFTKRYLPIHMIQFGRGCRSRCDFCAIRAFYGPGYAHRTIEDVVAEIRDAGSHRVFFVDDNLMTKVDVFKELMRALIPLKVRWSTQIDLGCADDPEVVALMQASGCQSLTIGIESLHEGTLARMAKGWNHTGDYAGQLARLREAGIMIYGCFVFGYPQDTAETFIETAQWALDQKLFLANFMPLMPLPGTPLYARLVQERRLVCDEWWKDPRFRWLDSLVIPESMSPEELSIGCRAARRHFNSPRGILVRLWKAPQHTRSWDNLMVYLMANLLGRRDRKAKYRASES